MSKRKLLPVILGVVLFVGLLVYVHRTYQKKEGYGDVFYNADLNPNMLSRPSFNSNLDPRNETMRSDPNVYGGFIRGTSPQPGNLASTNTVSSLPMNKPQNVKFSASQQVQNGKFSAGVNDAAQYVGYSDYSKIAPDFANIAQDQSQQKEMKEQEFKASLDNKDKSTLQYTLPSELLPTPDMRQSLTRDPSDPSNFMYDRTVFAPLKKRNRNEADRIRGDLDIAPIKTGYFDVATVPHVDLVKGYMGFFNDIQETQDIQDIAFQRARDVATDKKENLVKADSKLSSIMTVVGQRMMKPKLAYASPPSIPVVPDEELDPWYSDVSGVSKRAFQL